MVEAEKKIFKSKQKSEEKICYHYNNIYYHKQTANKYKREIHTFASGTQENEWKAVKCAAQIRILETNKTKQTHTRAIINYIHIWFNCAHVCSHHLYVTYKII